MKIMILKNILKGQSHQILDFLLLFVKLNWYGTFRRNIFIVFFGKKHVTASMKMLINMLILPKAASVSAEEVPKAASDKINRFLKVAGVETLTSFQHSIHIVDTNIRIFFWDGTRDFLNPNNI